MMNWRSIRWRLTALYAASLSGILIALGGLLAGAAGDCLKANLSRTQLRRARQIGQSLARMDLTGAGLAEDLDSLYAPTAFGRFIRITRPDGTVLYRSRLPQDRSFNPAEVPPTAAKSWRAGVREQKLPCCAPLMIGAWPCRSANGGRLLVEVGASTASIHGLVRLRLELLLGMLMAAVAAVAGTACLLCRALQPVEQLARQAEKLARRPMDERLPVLHTGDELEGLSEALNLTITRLQRAALSARRLGADTAHELRTPLTVLRGELENVVRDARLHPQLRGPLGSVLEEAECLAHTVAKLVALSWLQGGEASGCWLPVDLAALAVATTNQMTLLAEDKQISLSCETGQPVLVLGDRLRLKEVLVNLVDNAIRYTQPRGTVRVRAAISNNHALIEVADNGPGIPTEALPRLFERFSRPGSVRLAGEKGGTGFGLPFIKSICTAHGGEITVRTAPGQGACFQVELPLAGEANPKGSPFRVEKD